MSPPWRWLWTDGGERMDKGLLEAKERAVELLTGCFRRRNKLLLCGNGGSAADCGHIAGELIKGFLLRRPLPEEIRQALPADARLQRGLPAIDLCAQGAAISAIVNDLGGESIYAQQVLAFGRPGDVLLGISTSGNAKNVCLALQTAKALGLETLGLTGRSGGRMRPLCDCLLCAEADETFRVQEEHIRLYHELCAKVEARLFEE